MSEPWQQTDYYQPEYAPPPEDSPAAIRQRKSRMFTAITMLLVSAAFIFYAAMDFSLVDSYTGREGLVFVVSGVMYTLGVVFYIGVGVWILVTRKSQSIAPVIVALVLAGLFVLQDLFSVVTTAASGNTPQIGLLVLNAMIVMRTVVLLRFNATRKKAF